MIRCSAHGAYLLLVLQGRTLILDSALISFLRNNQMFNKKFNIYLKNELETCWAFADGTFLPYIHFS